MRFLSEETAAVIEAHVDARREADIESRRRLVERLMAASEFDVVPALPE